MGKWVILIGNAGFGPDRIKAMTFEGKMGIRDYGEKQFDVLFKEGYVSFQFDYDGSIMNDYSPEVIKSLPFDTPQFVLMRYSGRNLLESVLSSKDFPRDVLIDCDGVHLGLERLIDRSRLLNDGERPVKKAFCSATLKRGSPPPEGGPSYAKKKRPQHQKPHHCRCLEALL